jgi:hypothetical protein
MTDELLRPDWLVRPQKLAVLDAEYIVRRAAAARAAARSQE